MTDEEIKLFEQLTGIKLMCWQKDILKIIVNKEELRICMVPNNGRTYLRKMAKNVNDFITK